MITLLNQITASKDDLTALKHASSRVLKISHTDATKHLQKNIQRYIEPLFGEVDCRVATQIALNVNALVTRKVYTKSGMFLLLLDDTIQTITPEYDWLNHCVSVTFMDMFGDWHFLDIQIREARIYTEYNDSQALIAFADVDFPE
jgi:hypothetical protein